MTSKATSTYNAGFRYGLWTLGVYLIVFVLFWLTRPVSWREIFDPGVWFISYRLFPFLMGFTLLITGYSAIKGDRSQLVPSLVHVLMLIFYYTGWPILLLS